MVVNPETDIVVTPEALSTAGAVSYWRAGGTVSIAALRKAWVDAGLDEKLLRKEPEPETALRRAVLDLADRKRIVIANKEAEERTLVRPLQEPHAWAVVTEIVEEGLPPSYSTELIVRFNEGTPVFEPNGTDPEVFNRLRDTVLAGWGRQSGLFDPADVTGWLVKLAYKHCKAVTLRDSGGVYFIPRTAMEFWNKAADVIEKVSGRNHKVFRIPAMRNSECVEAITAAITEEAEQVVAEIEKELAESTIGQRALNTRKAAADALLAKLGEYEQLLDTQLAVRSRIEDLGASLAAQALANMVEDAA
jgi:hypothetical protein